MSLAVEKLENSMAKLTIEVDADKVEAALAAAYQKNKSKLSIPGFRKGKVPRQMVEKMYGPEIFYEDAANKMIGEAYEEELKNSDLDIVSRPVIDVVQIEKGKTFIFTAEVALKPEIGLGKYKGVKVEKVDVSVSADEVNAALEKERERNSRTIEVTDRAVKDGDMITLDYAGSVDDVAFDGGTAKDQALTIGSNTFIPGFEDQLIGAKIGEEMTVNVTFPEEYHEKSLAGKAAKFVCTVNTIKEKELPKLDDEFASEVSEFETLKEFKADIKANLEKEKAENAKAEIENAAIKAIVEDSKIDLPEAMLDYECEKMINNYAMQLAQQGLSIDQYFQFTGMTKERMKEQMRPQAEANTKSRLVLEAVAKAENIVASDEDYEEELKKMAEAYQMDLDKIKGLMGAEEEKMTREDIAIRKAAEFVAENAKEEKKKAAKKDKEEE